MAVDLQDGAAHDPRLPQKRIASTPSGRQVWVDISAEDRLTFIRQMRPRWPEIIVARERGETVRELHDRYGGRCSHGWRETQTGWQPDGECFLSEGIAAAYSILETQLHDLAQRRAALMV